ncbi:hypothetical protein HYC85_013519 [Camellia sinensis]|uniref:Myb-like domain-containing protein n=1 Tax=Camellia sinensis TaxID=4442 RepID=A0A7J7H3K2_CAMSI|nr:hypothetical protein HYC85_013519 [Camellia sinensis]
MGGAEVSSKEWDFRNMTEQEEDLIYRMYTLVGESRTTSKLGFSGGFLAPLKAVKPPLGDGFAGTRRSFAVAPPAKTAVINGGFVTAVKSGWDLIAGRIPGRKPEEIERFWIMKHTMKGLPQEENSPIKKEHS